MKYLRSYLLVPGAGGQILGSHSPVYRPHRRLTTGHHHNKVTSSYSSEYLLSQKRQVSTDGAKKSQLAVLGQVAPALPPPNGVEMDSYVSVHRHGAKSCPRDEAKSYPLADEGCQPRGSYFSVSPKALSEPMSYGQFLTHGQTSSMKSSLDPMSLEMAFLPTFHFFGNDVGRLFFSDRPKSAGVSSSSNLDAFPICPAEAIDSEIVDVERSKSLEALLPTSENTPMVDEVFIEVPTRNVKREVFLPRICGANVQNLPEGTFDTFLEVHNFQKRDSGGSSEEKSEDTCSFPKCEDSLNGPSSSLIIQGDRSSIIIHRDLYITNRILEKLKKIEEKIEITPEPSDKAGDHLAACSNDQGVASIVVEGLTQVDFPALADTVDSAVVHEQSTALVNSVASGDIFQEVDPEECSQAVSCQGSAGLTSYTSKANLGSMVAIPPAKPSSHFQKNIRSSDSYLTNIEFGMPTDRFSALEYMAQQSRKNLYARMKSMSSPCVLVDGVHVKHEKPEDVIPGLVKDNSMPALCSTAKTETHHNPVCLRFASSEINSMPAEMTPVPVSNKAVPETKHIPMGSSPIHDNSTPPENSLLLSESHNVPLVGVPHMMIPFQHQSDSQLQGTSALTHSELTVPNSDLNFFGDDSSKLQSELEDWFIPLGNEIDSMLLTLEASKSPIEFPKQIPQQMENDGSVLEEISKMEQDNSHKCEGVDIIENALLNPWDQHPFESGQYRDINTASGSLPPKSKNPNVDIKTETTIKCCRTGDNTDINVTETQRYLDKRLPYPFCTETVLQVYGTSDSLSKATQAVENSKAQLVHLSNANSPNPGMLTPKLQFNHMLSKSHENLKPNSKKTVLKIKVVPSTETPSPIKSSEPKPQPTHILQLTEQPAETSTDVSKLIRRSKFNHKPGHKKGRRGDSVMKLRPKKKFNKDSSENIKVLSPKDLEQMFPSPPKPKPVEKPRKVTIETKMGKESPVVVETVKQRSTQGGFAASQLKSRRGHDDILMKPNASKPTDTKVINQLANEVVGQNPKVNRAPKEESNAALSVRDQKILKSIISHKVKDSFMAVTKKVVNPEASDRVLHERLAEASPKPNTLNHTGKPKNTGVSDGTPSFENNTKPSIDITKLKSPTPQTVNNFPSEIKRDVNKSDHIYENDPKNVYASILGPAKEKQVKEEVSGRSALPKNPTPQENRQYVTVKIEPPLKTPTATATNATPEKVPHIRDKNVEKKYDESVLPVSANAMIAHVMKNSSEMSQSESRWHHLEKRTAPNENLSQQKAAIKSASDVQRRPASATLNVQQKPRKNETDMTSLSSHEIENKQTERVKMVNVMDSFKEKKVWNHPSEPLFFPFETPNYKEILQDPPKLKSTKPIPHENTIPESSAEPMYEADLRKLSTESTPRLVQWAPAKYQVPLDRMKDFPLLNPGKAKRYSVPSSGAVSINPLRDVVLLRTLTQVPAVTKVLGATLSTKSQQALDRWKQGLISTLGEEGFQEFYQNQLKRGTDFHSSVKKFLADRLDSKDDLCMRSLSGVLGSVSDVGVIESQVVHPLLGYRGVIDCVAKYKGKPVVIEWKRSDKAKPSLKHTYDAPLQLCAYFGAMNFDSNYKEQQVEGGLVVVAYSDGSPADVFELPVEECERYWAKWLKRLHQYYSKSASA